MIKIKIKQGLQIVKLLETEISYLPEKICPADLETTATLHW